jgi:hypothetical protein
METGTTVDHIYRAPVRPNGNPAQSIVQAIVSNVQSWENHAFDIGPTENMVFGCLEGFGITVCQRVSEFH